MLKEWRGINSHKVGKIEILKYEANRKWEERVSNKNIQTQLAKLCLLRLICIIKERKKKEKAVGIKEWIKNEWMHERKEGRKEIGEKGGEKGRKKGRNVGK